MLEIQIIHYTTNTFKMSIETLYVLTNLPTSVVRKIWYYTGERTRTAQIIYRLKQTVSRFVGHKNWIKSRTLWSVFKYEIEKTCFDINNISRLPIAIWREFRIMLLKMIGLNSYLFIKPLMQQIDKSFRDRHNAQFRGYKEIC